MSPALRACSLAVAVAATVAGAAPLEVRIEHPSAGQPAVGTVRVVVGVEGEARAITILVDGREAAVLAAPPWEADVDVGVEGGAHVFEAVARGPGGELARARLETAPAGLHDEVEVRLEQLYVTVSREGRRVLDLRPEEFDLRVGGVPQRIITFARGDVPFTAVLLIDASASMKGGKLATAIAGAHAFTAAMATYDEAALVLFSDRLAHATPFAGPGRVTLAHLDGLEAGGGTSVNDHLFLATTLLEGRQGRRVVVLLSDGVDVNSALSMADVIPSLRRGGALVYWIRPGGLRSSAGVTEAGKSFSAWRGGTEHREELELLGQAVAASGGRSIPVELPEDVTAAFAEVVRELRDQYVLGFYREGGGAVAVRATRPGVQVRTRSYAD